MITSEINGLFTINHLLFILISFTIITVLILLSFKLSIEQIKKQIKIIGIIIIFFEIIKIIFMIINKRNPSEYVPLYYCSLLIYFILFLYFKNEKIQNIGYSLIMYYGLVPGLFYILYPITAINFHPLISFDSLHSLGYHSLMLYLSLIIMIKRVQKFDLKDLKIYLISTLSMCFIAYVVNALFNTTFMYINYAPKDNPFLVFVENIVGIFYPIIIAVFQTLGSYIISYNVCKIIQKRK